VAVAEGSCDVRIDAGVVSAVVAAQFPDLAGAPVRLFGAGWDNEIYSAGPEWIFRFPKRAERVPWLSREIQIMAVVGDALGTAIPRFERSGTGSGLFPYPFVGYRRLAGVAADQSPVSNLAGLAADIGGLLGVLHRIDASEIPATPEAWERAPWSELRADLTAQADLIAPLLAPDLLARAGPYLAGEVAEPPQDGPRRFIHNDICPDHLLVDPATGRLTGLIDFGDAMNGEAVLDFAGLIGIGGYDFISQAAASYTLPLGAGFEAKLRWLARTLTLTWLADAARDNPHDLGKHLTWIERAFRD
jgi:aminoglycoside phosphotransferase (APT) family kinase protein